MRTNRGSFGILAGLLALVLAPAVGLGTVQAQDGAETAVPTFYADVQPILQENCVECHRPAGANFGGMVAPMSLITYEDARPWAPMMADAVEEGRMPPWFAAPEHRGVFENERYLEDEEKETILAWAEAGAPAGDPADAPYPIDRSGNDADQLQEGSPWMIGEPDIIVEFPEPFLVEDHVEDLNIGVPMVFPEDHNEPRWIKRSEIIPGSSAVHHICNTRVWGCITPGWPPYEYPDGFAILLPANPQMSFGMHYNKAPGPGTAIYDESRAGAVFYEDGEVIRHAVRRDVLGTRDILIPAGDPAFEVVHERLFRQDTYILSLTPHMHLRGKAAKYELEYPDGERELLLHVPNYDFHWQITYRFKEPPVAPKGSKLIWTATFDNSINNPHAPDPTRDVPHGGPTHDEMANGWLDYAHVEPINIVVGEPVPDELVAELFPEFDAIDEHDEEEALGGSAGAGEDR